MPTLAVQTNVRRKIARRECVAIVAKAHLNGQDVALAPDGAIAERSRPASITVDNGSEFAGRAMDAWADRQGGQLAFIRPGRPTENGFIESFKGRLRDKCLNVELLALMADAVRVLAAWHENHECCRPHSSLGDDTPAGVAAKVLEGTVPSCPRLGDHRKSKQFLPSVRQTCAGKP
jgi:putative transposase